MDPIHTPFLFIFVLLNFVLFLALVFAAESTAKWTKRNHAELEAIRELLQKNAETLKD